MMAIRLKFFVTFVCKKQHCFPCMASPLQALMKDPLQALAEKRAISSEFRCMGVIKVLNDANFM